MRQCELLDVCRSSLYYQPKPVSPADLGLMRRIDELQGLYRVSWAFSTGVLRGHEGSPLVMNGKKMIGDDLEKGLAILNRLLATRRPVREIDEELDELVDAQLIVPA